MASGIPPGKVFSLAAIEGKAQPEEEGKLIITMMMMMMVGKVVVLGKYLY